MQKLVIFSGAGMSAESGIRTFRDQDGLWQQYDIQQVASPAGWQRHPEVVQAFYNARRKQILAALPNAAHQLIADLESRYDVQVITQNIDDLHERAGSQHVLHLHGHIRFAKTSQPNAPADTALYPIDGWELDLQRDVCVDGYPLRPHVVWFGEAVPAYQHACELVQDADIFIVIGTRLAVYPVAGLINEISSHCRAYYIDPEADLQNLPAQYEIINEIASTGLAQLIDQL